MHTGKTKRDREIVAFDYIVVVPACFLNTSYFFLHLLMCTVAGPSLLCAAHTPAVAAPCVRPFGELTVPHR